MHPRCIPILEATAPAKRAYPHAGTAAPGPHAAPADARNDCEFQTGPLTEPSGTDAIVGGNGLDSSHPTTHPNREMCRHDPVPDPKSAAPAAAAPAAPAHAPDLHAVPDTSDARAISESILFEVRRVIVGQDAMLERILVGLLSGGHILLEGVPGLAKTLTIKTLADVLGGSFKRIQFTPDLMPSDLVGTRIYRPGAGHASRPSSARCSPTSCSPTRSTARRPRSRARCSRSCRSTRSRSATTTYPVPTPFIVLATENPIEAEGTYPLPEAQVDRFMLKILLGYPSATEEAQIVARSLRPGLPPREVLDAEELIALQASASTRSTSTRASSATRSASSKPPASSSYWGAPDLESYVSYGASPRGSINLVHGARALAVLRGRRYVLPSDVAELAPDVLRHRLVLSYAALADGITPDAVIARVLTLVRAPHLDMARRRPRRDATSATGSEAGRVRTPARPGPGPIADDLVRRLEVSLTRRVGGRMTGDHRGRGLGVGLELDRLRPYEPGDDVRRIDWNATARSLVPQVREDVPDRQLTAWLLLDQSASMHFGTADRRKADVAEGAALVVGRFVARRTDRLGVITFGSGERETIMPPAGGRIGHRRPGPGARARARRRGRRPDLDAARAAGHRRGRARPPGLVVIISDFRGALDWRREMTAIAGRHTVLAIEIADPREETPRRRRRAHPHRPRDRTHGPHRHRRPHSFDTPSMTPPPASAPPWRPSSPGWASDTSDFPPTAPG